ncbi:hypothetical protein Ddye_022439 [Dipteronia dyeriana]|uniref:Isopenicillin N synthase-like Fe(2+) 2OG dioxygenase domain-containing protein n=1 Tax=Dipteronia dyeriana TaxID=168575 RepID=A0AAD9U3M4_9ROSI|nr:hypothetical protein Ddye_022439 [Dipteronia dyeriana]
MLQYSKQVMEVGSLVVELLSEAPGLNSNHLKNMGCAEGMILLSHYYPACPQPELTMGSTKHADNDFLTSLLCFYKTILVASKFFIKIAGLMCPQFLELS